jgi:hypothetical protein
MCKINELLDNLSWTNPQKIQQEAINKLISLDNIDVLRLLQPGDKSCWENSAKIIKEIGYPRISIAIPGLLEWIKDLNWPGASIIMEVLENIESGVLIPYIENGLKKANDEKDSVWIFWIRELILRKKIEKTDFRQKDVYEIL